MNDCIFCKIIRKELPAKIEFEDSEVIAFWDVSPKAPVHILIVPKKHITSITDLEDSDALLMGKMIIAAKDLAQKHNIATNGYRLCFNVGKNSGQVVEHIHLHLIGGQTLGDMI